MSEVEYRLKAREKGHAKPMCLTMCMKPREKKKNSDRLAYEKCEICVCVYLIVFVYEIYEN